MLNRIPDENELRTLIGDAFYTEAQKVRVFLNEHYELETIWDKGWKDITYQCRYRRGGKTLCTLLYKPGEAACMIIFGAGEREKAEAVSLSPEGQAAYDAATTFHDGKWVWFSLTGEAVLQDIQMLLPLKRRKTK
ncbi:MAG: DUF3788 domain-containing protein [Eubacteriales bacterium]|nr:DUF3788 domain-containing protein [Eubacteriales bacterium]